jgi:hypothetical protein
VNIVRCKFCVANRREENHHELRVIRRGNVSIAHLSKPGIAISSPIVAEDILLPYRSGLPQFDDVQLYAAHSYWRLIVSALGPAKWRSAMSDISRKRLRSGGPPFLPWEETGGPERTELTGCVPGDEGQFDDFDRLGF